MAGYLIPVALSSEIDDNGFEHIHAAGPVASGRTILPLSVTGDMPDGDFADSVSGSYIGHGGITPYTSFSVIDGDFPDGVTLNTNGAYSGSFTSTGDFSWTVELTDSSGSKAQISDSSFVSQTLWWLVRQNTNTLYVSADLINGPWTPVTRSPNTGGALANIIPITTNNAILASSASSNTNGYVLSSLGIVGGTISGQAVNPNYYGMGSIYSDGILVLTRNNDPTYRISTDLGHTFTTYTFPNSTRAGNIVRLNNGRWLCHGVGTGSNVFALYSDQAIPTSWTVASDPITQLGANGYTFSNGTKGIILNRNKILQTINGSSWSYTGVDLPQSLANDSRCSFMEGDLFILSDGQNGNYFISRDAGTSWTYHSFGFGAITPQSMYKYNGITVINTYSSMVLYSNDGETTWHKITLPFTAGSFEPMSVAPLVKV